MIKKYKIRSKALLYSDFDSAWYVEWASKLKQTKSGRGKFALRANKFWQNAAIAQALYERGALKKGSRGIGFGVGMERLPSLFASMESKITATDQDFSNQKALSWDNDQLARGTESLNVDKICPEKLFVNNVSFRAANMKKLPKDLLKSQFDFLWSNCALGHLGSIQESMHFIEKSLGCLKSGGIAVHTTEANIISDELTLDNADTVFFRQRDFKRLFCELAKQGYKVEPLKFRLIKTKADNRYTLSPVWGNDHSKFLFNGYMATQVILIIHKPVNSNAFTRRLGIINHTKQYYLNLLHMWYFRRINRPLAILLKADSNAKKTEAKDTDIKPQKSTLKVNMKKGETKTIRMGYTNYSSSGLFNIYKNLVGTNPIAICTTEPINRKSKFMNKNWRTPDRPNIKFLHRKNDWEICETEYIQPGEDFYIEMELTAPAKKPRQYIENFSLVKEFDDIIPNTAIQISITVS